MIGIGHQWIGSNQQLVLVGQAVAVGIACRRQIQNGQRVAACREGVGAPDGIGCHQHQRALRTEDDGNRQHGGGAGRVDLRRARGDDWRAVGHERERRAGEVRAGYAKRVRRPERVDRPRRNRRDHRHGEQTDVAGLRRTGADRGDARRRSVERRALRVDHFRAAPDERLDRPHARHAERAVRKRHARFRKTGDGGAGHRPAVRIDDAADNGSERIGNDVDLQRRGDADVAAEIDCCCAKRQAGHAERRDERELIRRRRVDCARYAVDGNRRRHHGHIVGGVDDDGDRLAFDKRRAGRRRRDGDDRRYAFEIFEQPVLADIQPSVAADQVQIAAVDRYAIREVAEAPAEIGGINKGACSGIEFRHKSIVGAIRPLTVVELKR